MAESWSLKRTAQCRKCPWLVSTNPFDIPDGYSIDKHKALAETIAKPGVLVDLERPLAVMSCHEGEQAHCIGWLANQLGPGNNIALRLSVMRCTNVRKIRLRGEQHERFEDTLPKEA